MVSIQNLSIESKHAVYLSNSSFTWSKIDKIVNWCRVQKLKEQFANFYVVITLPTKEQNDSLIHSYIKWVNFNFTFNCILYIKLVLIWRTRIISLSFWRYGVQLGRPTFVPVRDLEMGFEKIVKIAHARGGKMAVLSS